MKIFFYVNSYLLCLFLSLYECVFIFFGPLPSFPCFSLSALHDREIKIKPIKSNEREISLIRQFRLRLGVSFEFEIKRLLVQTWLGDRTLLQGSQRNCSGIINNG